MKRLRYDRNVYSLGLVLLAAMVLFGFLASLAILVCFAIFGFYFLFMSLKQKDASGADKLREAILALLFWPLSIPFYWQKNDDFDEDDDPLLLDLIQRYGGKINASPELDFEKAADMSIVFTNLMREWNPVTFSVANFKKVAGEPTRVEENVMEYEFDNGWDGDLWRFEILADEIVSVERVGLD